MTLLTMVLQSVAAFFATFFFSIIFNISRTELVHCGIVGGIGWFIYVFFLNITDSIITSNFISAIFISFIAYFLARKRKMPVTIFLLSGIIPLVPGAGMYKTMYAFISKDAKSSAYYGIETLEIAGVIAIAIAIVLSFFNNYTKLFKTKKNGQ